MTPLHPTLLQVRASTSHITALTATTAAAAAAAIALVFRANLHTRDRSMRTQQQLLIAPIAILLLFLLVVYSHGCIHHSGGTDTRECRMHLNTWTQTQTQTQRQRQRQRQRQTQTQTHTHRGRDRHKQRSTAARVRETASRGKQTAHDAMHTQQRFTSRQAHRMCICTTSHLHPANLCCHCCGSLHVMSCLVMRLSFPFADQLSMSMTAHACHAMQTGCTQQIHTNRCTHTRDAVACIRHVMLSVQLSSPLPSSCVRSSSSSSSRSSPSLLPISPHPPPRMPTPTSTLHKHSNMTSSPYYAIHCWRGTPPTSRRCSTSHSIFSHNICHISPNSCKQVNDNAMPCDAMRCDGSAQPSYPCHDT